MRNSKRKVNEKVCDVVPPKKLTVMVGTTAANKLGGRKKKETKKIGKEKEESEDEEEGNILDCENAVDDEEVESDEEQRKVKGKGRNNEKVNEKETEEERTKKKEARGKKRLEEEKKVWKEGSWKIDLRKTGGFTGYGPKLRNMMDRERSCLDYFIHFFPQLFVREEVIPAINTAAKEVCLTWADVSYTEFLKFLGIIYSMEVLNLPIRKMYWSTEDNGLFQAPNYGRFMTRQRFEDII